MFETVKRLLSYFLGRSSQGAARPPASAPNQPLTSDEMPIPPGRPIERTVERQVIPGTRLSIMVTQSAYSGPDGSLDRVRDVRGVMAGCSHLVTSYEQLGGRCIFCQTEAAELVSAGATDLAALEAMTLFCVSCMSECALCRRTICRRHALQWQDDVGAVAYLCPTCREAADRARFFQKLMRAITFPFVNNPDQEHK